MSRLPLFAISCLLLAVTSCKGPEDVVFGPDPMLQIKAPTEELVELPEDDLLLLEGYLNSIDVAKSFGWPVKPVVGRTVGEVLVDARAWEAHVREQVAREEKADALKAAAQTKPASRQPPRKGTGSASAGR